MEKVKKYWIRFYSPGSIVTNDWSVDCEEGTRPEDVVWPDRAYAFSLHTRENVVDGDKVYRGSEEQIGPMYYHPDSKIENLAQVRNNPRATDTLINNMTYNDWCEVIWTRWDNWPQPYDPERVRILGHE